MGNLPSILTPDFGLLFWMLVSFLVVFLLLAKFGFPAIVKAVEERKNFIDESLKKAHEANEKLAGIQVESEKILREAREKQAQIIKEAMATRDGIIQDARDKAQLEGRGLLEEAKKQIEAEKEVALRDIRAQVAELSVQIAEKVIRRELQHDAEQEKFIERMLEEVK
ncbi:F0F1 ATP synthase subunit B [bacterium]|nr:F0F1 ATP synthase subunit B [Alloprevotella sp.]MBR4489958.1 F0F1 ATP synthase subunit B [bacterium]MBR6374615.1 F0F1 ATP synthase subunit B [Alloprevotella sp.]